MHFGTGATRVSEEIKNVVSYVILITTYKNQICFDGDGSVVFSTPTESTYFNGRGGYDVWS